MKTKGENENFIEKARLKPGEKVYFCRVLGDCFLWKIRPDILLCVKPVPRTGLKYKV